MSLRKAVPVLLLSGSLVVFAACQAPGARAPRSTASPATSAGTGNVTTGSGALDKFESQLRDIAAKVQPSVVQIDTPDGLGSGVVFDNQGDIVTNDHVVSGASSLSVITSDGHRYGASIVGTYASGDLAVVRVKNANLKPATFDDSGSLKVGDIVLALGSPYGLQGTMTEGIVSATGRSEDEGNGVTLKNLIQTSAPVYPGDSGGALVDLNGRVVGMPTLSSGTGGRRAAQAPGVAFAIPSSSIVPVAKQLISAGKVSHTGIPYLGVTLQDAPDGGALVSTVVAGGPAAKAGLQPRSVILALGDRTVADVAGLSQALAAFKPGEKVAVHISKPDGSSGDLTVTLGELPVS
jgi:S1-C subfamily serine protease